MWVDLSEIPIERHVHERCGASLWAWVVRDFFFHDKPTELRQSLGVERLAGEAAGETGCVEQAFQIFRAEVRDAGAAETQLSVVR